MRMKKLLLTVVAGLTFGLLAAKDDIPKVPIWDRIELTFDSPVAYDRPVYDVALQVTFVAPSGKQYPSDGFWDGENRWRVRFMPNEKGKWSYRTVCSDAANSGLHDRSGTFVCTKNRSSLPIYRNGKIVHRKGDYYLSYADGTPFFYLGCTAWNGALRSTDEEWETYLQHRKQHAYTVIQFVTTQWRGLPASELDPPAFSGEDPIRINPLFFQRLDRKIDRINRMGLVAAPIMLWAIPGDENPGYKLPVESAVKLAAYIKARYEAYHVIWNLGGDGNFTGSNLAKWQEIGRRVFGEGKNAVGNVVTLHPGGRRWYGNDYDGEEWLSMISYQTGHSNSESTIRWKTQGPVVENWARLKPRPIIDTEPVYEAQGEPGNAYEVRKSIFWGMFSAPVAGVGYGAWSTWPWLRVGEKSFNHGMKKPSQYDWKDGIESSGSIQVGRLHAFFDRFAWWKLRPQADLLEDNGASEHVSRTMMVVADDKAETILVYVPTAQRVAVKNERNRRFKKASWYYPATGLYEKAELSYTEDRIETESHSDEDAILVLQ